jgi:hypothetical protein
MVIQLLLLLTGRLQLLGAAVIEKLESLVAAGAEYDVGFRLTVHCAHPGEATANRKERHRRPLATITGAGKAVDWLGIRARSTRETDLADK